MNDRFDARAAKIVASVEPLLQKALSRSPPLNQANIQLSLTRMPRANVVHIKLVAIDGAWIEKRYSTGLPSNLALDLAIKVHVQSFVLGYPSIKPQSRPVTGPRLSWHSLD